MQLELVKALDHPTSPFCCGHAAVTSSRACRCLQARRSRASANLLSHIFNITTDTGNFTFTGLTLTGGRTIDDNAAGLDTTFSGGAIRSLTSGSLAVDQSTISGNSTTGNYSGGGGIFSILGDRTLTSSTVSGNSTAGNFASGGGIRSSDAVTLASSTVTENQANASNAVGSGIWNSTDTITITNSIVAGNTAGGGIPDINPGTGTFSVNYSLIGTGVVPDAGTSGNNVVTNNPLIGPLANNGGPTEMHALLPGSRRG